MATITSIKDRINQMDQASFQILCDAYLSRIGYQNLVSLGTKAGAQKTTPGTPDTYFCISGGKYIFAEYTTQKDGLVEKIRKDIQKCLDVEFTQVDLSEMGNSFPSLETAHTGLHSGPHRRVFCSLVHDRPRIFFSLIFVYSDPSGEVPDDSATAFFSTCESFLYTHTNIFCV